MIYDNFERKHCSTVIQESISSFFQQMHTIDLGNGTQNCFLQMKWGCLSFGKADLSGQLLWCSVKAFYIL